MTSACNSKDILRNYTQVFLRFRYSFFEICLHLINSNFTPYLLFSSAVSSGAGTSKEIPFDEMDLSLPAVPITFGFQRLPFSSFDMEYLLSLKFNSSKTSLTSSITSTGSDVFYVVQPSTYQSLPRPNSPIVLDSTEISGNDTREMPSISSITSPEP